jgi:hypothetical protein
MKNRKWLWLLLLPWLALLSPPLYSRIDPQLFGFPFFYWYQLAWVPLTAVVTFVVHRKTR